MPTFYDRDDRGVPLGWVRVVKESIRTVLPRFSTRRMVKDTHAASTRRPSAR